MFSAKKEKKMWGLRARYNRCWEGRKGGREGGRVGVVVGGCFWKVV